MFAIFFDLLKWLASQWWLWLAALTLWAATHVI